MRRLRAVFRRIRALVQRDRFDRELADELQSHLALHIDDNLRTRMSAEDARRHALVTLGGVAQIEEQHIGAVAGVAAAFAGAPLLSPILLGVPPRNLPVIAFCLRHSRPRDPGGSVVSHAPGAGIQPGDAPAARLISLVP